MSRFVALIYCFLVVLDLLYSCHALKPLVAIDTAQIQKVQDYYGKVLSTNQDLKSTACCSTESLPRHVKQLIQNVDQEIITKFYGCGAPIPLALENQTVLDLGCGTGRDCYLLSQLVGPHGHVIGIDMTEEQLTVANKHVDSHMERFGYTSPNVEFRMGFMEDLQSIGIEDNSMDCVVSNCVMNLSPDKPRLFREIIRVLKPGGEIYFSDVFVDRRLPSHCAKDPVLLGECLGAAMYIEDFRRLMGQLGIQDYRIISKRPIQLTNSEVESKIGFANFYSITIRAFKVLDLEDKSEDYGQSAYYLGTIPLSPDEFQLDENHVFKVNSPVRVSSNTAMMLEQSRFGKHFCIVGDLSNHLGLFDTAASNMAVKRTNGCSPSTQSTKGSCC